MWNIIQTIHYFISRCSISMLFIYYCKNIFLKLLNKDIVHLSKCTTGIVNKTNINIVLCCVSNKKNKIGFIIIY